MDKIEIAARSKETVIAYIDMSGDIVMRMYTDEADHLERIEPGHPVGVWLDDNDGTWNACEWEPDAPTNQRVITDPTEIVLVLRGSN